ncbi:uncharacterized protein V6R79_005176 [Siganus canaliculatus]
MDEGDCRGIKLVRLVVGAARKPQKWSQIYHSKCLAVKLDAHKRPLSVLAAELNADLCDECPDGRECVLQHLHHASADCCHRLVVLALMLPFSAHTYRGCSHLCSADMDEGDCRGIKLVRLVVGAARKPQKWSQIYHSKCLAVKLDAHKQPLSQIYHSKCLAVKLDAHKRPLSVLAAELNADLCDECPDGRECVLQHLHHASADCCHRLVVLALMLPFSAHTYRGCSHLCSADMDEGDCRGIKLVRLVVGAARKPQKWSQIYHSKCLAVKLDAHKQPLSQIYHSKCLAVKLDAHKRPLSVLAAELNADLCDECPDGRECVLQHLHHASADCCHRLVVLALMLPFSAHTYRGCSHNDECSGVGVESGGASASSASESNAAHHCLLRFHRDTLRERTRGDSLGYLSRRIRRQHHSTFETGASPVSCQTMRNTLSPHEPGQHFGPYCSPFKLECE